MTISKNLISNILKNIIPAIILIAIAIMAVLFSVKKIDSINAKLQERKQLSFFLKNRNEIIANLAKDLDFIGNNDQEIIKAFPQANNIIPFIEALESIAAKNSLEYSLKFDNLVEVSAISQELTVMSVDFIISATQSNITKTLSYIKDLEDLPFFVSVTSVNLNSQSPKGWNDNSNVTINGKLYVRK